MRLRGRTTFTLVAVFAAIFTFGLVAHTQQTHYPKPTELPNPYRLVQGWPMLPKSMNAGRWGEVIRVHVASNGNIWVFHRCFNTVPPGHATCIGRGVANPPILVFDPSGKLLKSFGVGLFAYPHGFTLDRDGNIWTSDVNDEATVLGMSARNSNGVIIVSDGHAPNQHNNARVMKFAKDGRFIKAWGHKGAGPGDFDEPHDIFIGGSQSRLYVADRRNNRIQVFDQDGKFIVAWTQFGQPSSVFVGKDDTIYVGASFPDPTAKKGELRGITIGNAKTGSLTAFIPDPSDLDQVDVGTSASGIAADDMGNIYAADVGTHGLRKYVKVK